MLAGWDAASGNMLITSTSVPRKGGFSSWEDVKLHLWVRHLPHLLPLLLPPTDVSSLLSSSLVRSLYRGGEAGDIRAAWKEFF